MVEFFSGPGTPGNIWIIIVLIGLVTYITRSAGYVVLSRFKTLHPRVEAALEAVPGAVLVTLVLPSALTNGPVELVALITALFVSFRLNPIWVIGIGMIIVVSGRAMGW